MMEVVSEMKTKSDVFVNAMKGIHVILSEMNLDANIIFFFV